MIPAGWAGRLAAALAVAALAVPVPTLGADRNYKQRDRDGASYFEGVREKGVSGLDVELVAVQVDRPAPRAGGGSAGSPDELALCFFLPDRNPKDQKQVGPTDVFLTVRELDYESYYWLDRVRPKGGWKPGRWNRFAWSTEEVLRELDALEPRDLGALVRLFRAEPGLEEIVAPVALMPGRGSVAGEPAEEVEAVRGYRFVLRPAEDAKISGTVTPVGGGEPAKLRERRASGGRPVVFRWAPSKEGKDYRVRFRGRFLNSGRKLDKTVVLHHEPQVAAACLPG